MPLAFDAIEINPEMCAVGDSLYLWPTPLYDTQDTPQNTPMGTYSDAAIRRILKFHRQILNHSL
jgi:hypothetical protein